MNEKKRPDISRAWLYYTGDSRKAGLVAAHAFGDSIKFFRSTFLFLGTWAATILSQQALLKERPS